MLGKTLLISAFIVTLPLTSFGAAITQIVVFGDSLSDNGNAASATGGTLPGNYARNALTNGPTTIPATTSPLGLWIDQFAQKLGVSDPLPFVAGGTNYAVASAKTGHNPAFTLGTFPPTAVPYTSDQVALYLSTHTASANTLYAFWAGSNDINQSPTPAAALNAAFTAADNIKSNIQTLAASGAKQFVWLNEPLLGATPLGIASGPAGVAALNAASKAFNASWVINTTLLAAQGISVTGVDIEQLFTQVTTNPSQFGFTNVTAPAGCQFALSTPGCAANNPNQFLFWDGEHPTTAANAQIATLAFNAISGPAGPSNVPEPASTGFVLGGLSILGVVTNVKRRRLKAQRS
jgi:outer membrane lipase/esterase